MVNNTKNQTLSFFYDRSMTDYDKFIKWWSTCDENEIASNSLLLSSYRIMCLYNEVRNGGFEQFWNFTENSKWDMERTEKIFKWFLPREFFDLFIQAFNSRKNGENCEKYNSLFDYGTMENKVLPKLAQRVVNNFKNKVTLTEYDLIEGIAPYLKQQGYKKKNKRWTKVCGEFTLSFYIQGSAFDIDNYYIRPGVFVNGIEQVGLDFYGHFAIDLKQESLEQVIRDYEQFIKEWTDKPLIKERLLRFNKWERWHPFEKRREMSAKKLYKLFFQNDSLLIGCYVFFSVNDVLKKYILQNY